MVKKDLFYDFWLFVTYINSAFFSKTLEYTDVLVDRNPWFDCYESHYPTTYRKIHRIPISPWELYS